MGLPYCIVILSGDFGREGSVYGIIGSTYGATKCRDPSLGVLGFADDSAASG